MLLEMLSHNGEPIASQKQLCNNLIRACTLTLGSVNSSLWDSDTVDMEFDRNSMLSVDQVAFELLHLANQIIY